MSAGLFLIFTLYFDFCLNCLPVRDYNIKKLNVCLVFVFKFIYKYVYLLVAYAIDNRLFCFLIYLYFNSRVFLSELNKRSGDLVVVSLCLGSYGA